MSEVVDTANSMLFCGTAPNRLAHGHRVVCHKLHAATLLLVGSQSHYEESRNHDLTDAQKLNLSTWH